MYVLKLVQIVFIKWNNSEKRTYAHEIILLFELNHSFQIMLNIWLVHSAALYKMHLFQFLPPCEGAIQKYVTLNAGGGGGTWL